MRRVSVITGASRGLGREIAIRFGRAGWSVAVNYLSGKDGAQTVAKEITDAGGEAFACRADVSCYPQVEAMIDETLARFGRIDLVVNNAGRTAGGLIARLTDEQWRSVMDTNLKGAFNTTRAVSRTMMKQKSGHIINIASILGIRGKAGQAAYSTSKASLIGLTKAAAVELAPRGIRVNAVLPGFMLTDMGANATEKYRAEALADNLLKRFSVPAEVAEFILHLSGMNAVSGQVFNLDSRMT